MSRLDKIRGFLGFGLVSRVTLLEAIAITTHLGNEPQHWPAGRRKRCSSAAVTRAAISGPRGLRGPRTGPRFVSCAFCVPRLYSPYPRAYLFSGTQYCPGLFVGCALILHRLLESLLSLLLSHDAVRLQEVQRHSQVGLLVEQHSDKTFSLKAACGESF